MKRTERHHLKQNELASSVVRAREQVTEHKSQFLLIALVAAMLVAAMGGYAYWRSRTNNQAGEMLAAAMEVASAPVTPPAADATTPPPPPAPGTYPSEQAKLDAALPKFLAAADAYPSAQAGIAARYHAAAILATLGRTADAQTRYTEVIDRDKGIYGEMAKLGLAEMQVAGGKHDEAIRQWKELAEQKDGSLPLDGVLMHLARTYGAAGKVADAQATFKRVVDEFPLSPYAADAKQELDALSAPAAPKG